MELLKKYLASSGLTYLPLAVIQAAAYINDNRIMLADYLSLLKEGEEEIIDLLSKEFEDSGRYHNVLAMLAMLAMLTSMANLASTFWALDKQTSSCSQV